MADVPHRQASSSSPGGFLGAIERVGNRLPDPLMLFIGMALLVPLLSSIAVALDWQRAHPLTGEVIRAVNLLEKTQLQRMFTEAVGNFTAFPPLGVVLVAMLGIGVAERSGFIVAALRGALRATPAWLITPSLVLLGILSNVATDAGYVVIVPMGAVVFAAAGRHPIAGLCAAFAGVSGGFSANLVITSLDPLLAGITEAAAQLYTPDIQVLPTANYYFMLVSTFIVLGAAWLVTDKVVEPRLGTWNGIGSMDQPIVSVPAEDERRALRWAWATCGLAAVIAALLVVPSGGLLRGEDGSLGPFYASLIPLLALLFLVPGLVFGYLVGTLRNSHDFSKMLADSMAGMGGYIVLAFFAAQFIAYFQWSNLGMLIALTGADALRNVGIGPIPLLLGILVLTATINLFVGSASAKWALLAPVLVPMMMSLGFTPELAQAAFRVGDSTTNIITPLLPYFPIILIFAKKYQPEIRLGTLISAMMPYSIAFSIAWGALLVAWFVLAWPLGPQAGLMIP